MIVSSRPKIPRNRFGSHANNNYSGGGSSSTSGGGSDTPYVDGMLWGNRFTGYETIDGDITSNGSISVSGDAVIGGITETEYLDVNKDASVYGELYVQGDFTADSSTYLVDVNSRSINNSETIKTKNLTVTGRATFFELLIEQISATNGSLMITPARGFEIDWVQHIGSYVYLFFRQNLNGIAVRQTWKVGDLLLHADFNKAQVGLSSSVSNSYYWALVDAVSENPVTNLPFNPYTNIAAMTGHGNSDGSAVYYHWVRIRQSEGNYDGTLEPEVGDDCVQCGYRGTDDPQRQSAIYIATVDSLDSGIKAPFIAQYRGINEFSLSKFRKSYFDANGAKFFGDFEITGEVQQTIQDKIDDYMSNHPVATPYIGDNGNWWIDGKDTGIKASGNTPTITIVDGYWYVDGVSTGVKATGNDGVTPLVEIKNGTWWINGKDTGVKAEGEDGTTPTIEIKNGTWWINGKDTGVKAEGQDGTTPNIGSNGNWWVGATDTGVKAEGEDGEDGDSAINFVLNPGQVVFNTGEDGKVTEAYKLVTISVYQDGKKLTPSSVTTGSTTNCGFLQPAAITWSNINCYILIRDTDYTEVETIKGKSYIAPSLGVANVTITVEGVDYSVPIPVSVNIQKYVNNFHVGLKEFKSEYEEYVSDTSTTLTSHYSLIQLNAREIAMKVGQNELYPNYYSNPIYKKFEYKTGVGTDAFGFNSGSPTDRAKFSMLCAQSFDYKTSSTVTEIISSPWAADGGHIYKLSTNSILSDSVSLYAIDDKNSTGFLNRRVKLKGGQTYTISVWVAMPVVYNKQQINTVMSAPNLFEINVWNEENGVGLGNRPFRKTLSITDTNLASRHGQWLLYYITFKTPRNEDITLGDYTAFYGNDCYLSLEPILSLTKTTRPIEMYFGGIKIEEGDKATAMTTTRTDLLDTGIDIVNQKITFTSDNIIALNNRGETTFSLNANGDVQIGGHGTFNGFVFTPPCIITADNYNDYCYIQELDEDDPESIIKIMDLERTSPYIIIQSLPGVIPNSGRTASKVSALPISSLFTNGTINAGTAQICDDLLCYAQDYLIPYVSPIDASLVVFDLLNGETITRPVTQDDEDWVQTYVSPIYLPSINQDGSVYHFREDITTEQKIRDIRKYINTPIVIINYSNQSIGLGGVLTLVSPRGEKSSGVSTTIPAKSARYCKPVYSFTLRNGKYYEWLMWEISQVYPQSDGLLEMIL